MIIVVIISILVAIAIPMFETEKAQEAIETRLVEQNGQRVWSQTTNTEHTYSMWIMDIERKHLLPSGMCLESEKCREEK